MGLFFGQVMMVQRQDPVSKTTCAEAKAVCKHECPHLGCHHVFHSKRGALVHAATCQWKREFEVDAIIDFRGQPTRRQYHVKWKGYKDTANTWEPRSNLHPEAIRDYELEAGVYLHTWPHRCDICDLPCASQRGIKIHKARMHKEAPIQNFAGTLADSTVQHNKLK